MPISERCCSTERVTKHTLWSTLSRGGRGLQCKLCTHLNHIVYFKISSPISVAINQKQKHFLCLVLVFVYHFEMVYWSKDFCLHVNTVYGTISKSVHSDSNDENDSLPYVRVTRWLLCQNLLFIWFYRVWEKYENQ